MIDHLLPVRLHVDRARIQAYAVISDDFNPIHVDPEFAAKSPLGGVIAHGTLSLNLIWQTIEQTFGTPAGSLHLTEVKFRLPVRENDIVEAGGERVDAGIFSIWVRNQHGVTVIEGTASFNVGEN